LASRQGFGERKTEQLGGHSQEQQRHRQAPIDDDETGWQWGASNARGCEKITISNQYLASSRK